MYDLSLPGSKYIGPGNKLRKGKPVGKADKLALKHDHQYANAGENANGEEIRAADREYMKENLRLMVAESDPYAAAGLAGIGIKYGAESLVGVQYPFGADAETDGPSVERPNPRETMPSVKRNGGPLDRDSSKKIQLENEATPAKQPAVAGDSGGASGMEVDASGVGLANNGGSQNNDGGAAGTSFIQDSYWAVPDQSLSANDNDNRTMIMRDKPIVPLGQYCYPFMFTKELKSRFTQAKNSDLFRTWSWDTSGVRIYNMNAYSVNKQGDGDSAEIRTLKTSPTWLEKTTFSGGNMGAVTMHLKSVGKTDDDAEETCFLPIMSLIDPIPRDDMDWWNVKDDEEYKGDVQAATLDKNWLYEPKQFSELVGSANQEHFSNPYMTEVRTGADVVVEMSQLHAVPQMGYAERMANYPANKFGNTIAEFKGDVREASISRTSRQNQPTSHTRLYDRNNVTNIQMSEQYFDHHPPKQKQPFVSYYMHAIIKTINSIETVIHCRATPSPDKPDNFTVEDLETYIRAELPPWALWKEFDKEGSEEPDVKPLKHQTFPTTWLPATDSSHAYTQVPGNRGPSRSYDMISNAVHYDFQNNKIIESIDMRVAKIGKLNFHGNQNQSLLVSPTDMYNNLNENVSILPLRSWEKAAKVTHQSFVLNM